MKVYENDCVDCGLPCLYSGCPIIILLIGIVIAAKKKCFQKILES